MQNIVEAQEMVPLSWSIFLSVQSCPNACLFQSNLGYLSKYDNSSQASPLF